MKHKKCQCCIIVLACDARWAGKASGTNSFHHHRHRRTLRSHCRRLLIFQRSARLVLGLTGRVKWLSLESANHLFQIYDIIPLLSSGRTLKKNDDRKETRVILLFEILLHNSGSIHSRVSRVVFNIMLQNKNEPLKECN